MKKSAHTLPLTAREQLVLRVLDRFEHPDDAHESPKDFIQPGFYGLGGVGKSHLLREIEQRARTITPYVIHIDFDSRQAEPAPETPLAFVRQLINTLETIDADQRTFWKKRNNPFQACRAIIDNWRPIQVIQNLTAQEAHVSGVEMNVNILETKIPAALAQAFEQALAHLSKQVKLTRKYRGAGQPPPRPMVLILLDTLEAAPRPMRDWLPRGLRELFDPHIKQAHVLIVAAGRERIDPLLATELPPLSAKDAAVFLRLYIAERLREDANYASLRHLEPLCEDSSLQRQVIKLSEGIPLLLQLLADLAAAAPGTLTELPAALPGGYEQRIRYVLERYLQHLRDLAATQDDAQQWSHYWLVLYSAVPRRIPSANLLRALLQDLPDAKFAAPTNYDALYQRLTREAFIQTAATGTALIYHVLIRDGILTFLRQDDVQRWHELHRRAATWFQTQGEPTETLYHLLHTDYAATIQSLRQQIEAALAAQAWPQAQELLDTTSDLPLAPDDAAWCTLYKAELAWGEGQLTLAQKGLQPLLQLTLPPALNEHMTARVEAWFAFSVTMADEVIARMDRICLHYLYWWASQLAVPTIQAKALNGLGDVVYYQDSYAEAQRYYNQALDFAHQVNDRRTQGEALRGLGDVARMQEHYAEAQRYYNQALDFARQVNDRHGQGVALRGLGDVVYYQDRYTEAQSYYNLALDLYRQVDDSHGRAKTLNGLGDVARMQDSYAEAQRYYNQALDFARQAHDRRTQGVALRRLGDVAYDQDSYAEAQRYYNQALDFARQVNDHHGQGVALRRLGDVVYYQDRYTEAQHYYNQALDSAHQADCRRCQTWAQYRLGEIAVQQNHYADAKQWFIEVLTFFTTIQDYRRALISCISWGRRALEHTTTQRSAEHVALSDEAGALARFLAQAGRQLLNAAPPDAPLGDLPQRLIALEVQLADTCPPDEA